MEFGPIQLIVIGFDDIEHFQGQIYRELNAVRSRGVIRLVDALAVVKDQDGHILALEASDLTGGEAAEIGNVIRLMLGMSEVEVTTDGETDEMLAAGIGLTTEDVMAAAENLEPGTAALYLLIEHTWATGLKQAVRSAGGRPLVQGFLTPEVVMMIGAELEAILEAEATIELAFAVKGAAILDALITMESVQTVSEDMELEAEEEAVEIAGDFQQIRAVAAAEAVRALIVADLLEDEEAEEATRALVAAGLIEDSSIQEAAQYAEQAGAEFESPP